MTISTSKIRKIMVIKKKRSEKGIRWVEFLSKPHSKGDDFSRLSLDFFLRANEIKRTTEVISIIRGVNKIS
jgi:hypothetical protein